MTAPSATETLAHFSIRTRLTDLPASTRHAGRRTILNALALGSGASRHEVVERALAAVSLFRTPGECGLLGRDERLAPVWAALINGIAIHVEDFDDTHLATVAHPGAPVVPAALAAGEMVDASGAALLAAVIVGIEVALRVGLGLGPGHFDRGWHVTGTTGHVGAAAAAGRLLGLSEEAMARALSMAATQAAGLQAALGTMTKAFHPGKAAANGVESALLAAEGFTAPSNAVEGRRGFAEVYAPSVQYGPMLDTLGQHWEIESNAFKPYACGIVSHPAIDAAIALRHEIAGCDEIARVDVQVNPVVLDVMGIKDPQSGLQSKFSVYHCVAVGFLDGVAGPAQYSDDRARAPEVGVLRQKVHVTTDPAIARDETDMSVLTTAGERRHYHVLHATASASNPMSDDQLRAKAELVAGPVLGAELSRLCDLAFHLEDVPDIRSLFNATRPHAVGSTQS